MSALLAQGEKFDQLNLNKLALAHYQKAVKRYHNAAKAHIRLGMLPKLDNQANQALDCFNTTIALNKNSALVIKNEVGFTRVSIGHMTPLLISKRHYPLMVIYINIITPLLLTIAHWAG